MQKSRRCPLEKKVRCFLRGGDLREEGFICMVSSDKRRVGMEGYVMALLGLHHAGGGRALLGGEVTSGS